MSRPWFSIFLSRTFLKYVLVGVLGTAIDVGLLAVLVEMFHVDPKQDSLFYVFVSISFFAAVVNNFILNQWWTFRAPGKGQKRRFIKFLLVSLIGLFLSNICVFFFINVIDFLAVWKGYHLSNVTLAVSAKLFTSVIILLWNFLANKYWTFRVRVYPKKDTVSSKKGPEFSIIIPAYNEERRLPETLHKVILFFKSFQHSYEILIVDDGSKDNTVSLMQKIIEEAGLQETVRVLTAVKNAGKGSAVRRGVLAAQGEYILFTDADNSTPIEELEKFSSKLKDADVLIGSRYLKESNVEVHQPWYRFVIGRISNLIIQIVLVDDIKDTQCGFKLFRRDVAHDIFSRMKVDGFGFDMEALALAEVLGYHIKELPVSWFNSDDSRVRPIRDTIRTFGDLLFIKLNIWTGKYKDSQDYSKSIASPKL